MNLTEFLLARIAEDEERVDAIPEWYCTNSARGDGWGSRGECPLCGHYMFDGTESVTKEAFWDHYEDVHRRSRVLAECEAKRRIVELHESWPVLVETPPERTKADDLNDMTLRLTRRIAWLTQDEYRKRFGSEPPTAPVMSLLVLPYADHPDFREEWRS